MIEMLQQISEEINSLPDYVGKGLVELIVIIVGGIIVGWITSSYFALKAAESEVKGDIMKKKLDIYDALVVKLDVFQQEVVLSQELINTALIDIKSCNISLKYQPQYPVLDVFQAGDKLTEAVLDMDRFISANRIYFEKGLYEKLQFFQNYIIIFNRLIVMYREQFVNENISLENKSVKAFENILAIELGLILQDELSHQIESVHNKIRSSVSNIRFKVQSNSDHSANRFGVDGEIVQELLKLKIMKERDNIKKLITENVAKGMASSIAKS